MNDNTLGELVPGLASLPGTPRDMIKSRLLFRPLPAKPTWADVDALKVDTLMHVGGMGPARLNGMIRQLEHLVETCGVVPSTAADDDESESGREISDLCEELLDLFDDREQIVLPRVLDLDGSAPTLEQIGTQLGLTRERVRQIQVETERRIAELVTRGRFAPIGAFARDLRERIGVMRRLDRNPEDLIPVVEERSIALLLRLAGPYVVTGDWVHLKEAGRPDIIFESVLEGLAVEGCAPNDAVRTALESTGVDGAVLEDLVESSKKYRVLDGMIVDWKTSMHQRAYVVLRIAGRVMTKDELIEAVDPSGVRGFLNQISTDPRIERVGLGRYALTEWGIGEYENIETTMIDRLRNGPIDIAELAEQLHEEFGIAIDSVPIHATMNPAFVHEGDRVRLRRPDEPFIPKQTLETSPDCFQDGLGRWGLRVLVDSDVIRGSGRAIPEPFALHLGLSPRCRMELDTDLGVLPMNWKMKPNIGSVRRVAHLLEARPDDHLVLTAVAIGRAEWSVERTGSNEHPPLGPAELVDEIIDDDWL